MSSHESTESTYEIYTHTLTEMRDLLIDLKDKDEDIRWREKAEALEKELKSLKKNKNYWLFWKEKREEFDTKTKDSLPVLTELTDLTITQDATPAHVIIEGDNYHVLSVLSYTHQWQVDVIYIDPPYNTGNKDFIYNDHYVDREDSFRHSKWLSFMEKRLTLARDLMKDTGVIFISIDDNEQAQLKLLCDEVFGEKNFLAQIIIHANPKWRVLDKHFAKNHEYLIAYSKDINSVNVTVSKTSDEVSHQFKEEDEWWFFRYLELRNTHKEFWKYNRPNLYYPFYVTEQWEILFENAKNTVEVYPNWDDWFQWCWTWWLEKSISDQNYLKAKFVKWRWKIYRKAYVQMDEENNVLDTKKLKTIWYENIFNTEKGKILLTDIVWSTNFTAPKSIDIIKNTILCSSKDALILDFFAGSGTTGHAVLALNQEDGGNRRFILCSNRENTAEFPDKNICRDITYERVRRVATGYTNMKWVEVAWLGGNIRYLQAEFIPKHKWTDNIRNRMVERCSEMLCLRENIWEPMADISTREMRFYQRGDRYLAILFWLFCFEEFSDILRSLDRPISIYVFSRGQMTRDDFEGISVAYTVEEIPDPILAIYKIIFWL